MTPAEEKSLKIVRFCSVVHFSNLKFHLEVNKKLKEGWELYGDTKIIRSIPDDLKISMNDGYTFQQSMVVRK